MGRESVLEEIINGYRKVIEDRYQYQHLIDQIALPESVESATVDHLRSYFLDYIYPNYEKRQTLNLAFQSLRTFLRQPKKLISILISSLRLSFKYGRHLPNLLRTGLNAFQSYTATTHFEEQLVKKAIENKVEAPFDQSKIYDLIRLLPRTEIDKFMDNSLSLFETLHNRTLIKKIIEVLDYVVKTMKNKSDIYSTQEIKGLEFGLESLKEGDRIFQKLSPENQRILLPMIMKIEKKSMESIFGTSS